MNNNTPSKEYIDYICDLYGEPYDDRLEDTRPPVAGEENRISGSDWKPGKKAEHKSLGGFQKELEDQGIHISTSKIRKILITGGCWSTERSRQINKLYEMYTVEPDDGGVGLSSKAAIKRIADELQVSVVTVNVNLPYLNVVYNLEDKSSNAKRCEKYKKRKKENVRNINIPINNPDVNMLEIDTVSKLRELQNSYNNSMPILRKSISDALSPLFLSTFKMLGEQMRETIPAAIKEMSIWRDFMYDISFYAKEAIKSIKSAIGPILDRFPVLNAINKLSKVQYVVWMRVSEDFVSEISSCDTDSAVMDYLCEVYDNYEFLSVSEPIEKMGDISFSVTNSTYQQSLSAFEKGDYDIAAMGFASLIDRFLSEYITDKEMVSISGRVKHLLNKIEEFEDDIELSNDEYSQLLLLFTFNSSIESYAKRESFKKDEPQTINRNWLMHGRYNRSMERMDCVRLIRMLYGTVLINQLVEKTMN